MTTTARRPAPVHDPMSADYPALEATVGEAARALPRYLGPVLTVDGVRAQGWEVMRDRTLPVGTIAIRPAVLRIAVAEEGDLVLALAIAEERRQANRTLRRLVVDVALRAGLTDLRPFARPAGATR